VELEVVTIGEGGVAEAGILVHDETNRALANILAAMQPPHFPVALGVLYCNPEASFEARMASQVDQSAPPMTPSDLNALLRRGYTWTVEG
jgi:2-oxoglutarate ferredoxin oxidoreductase subunit beta